MIDETTAVTDEAPAPAETPVAPAIKYAELDAVLPDDIDDEDFRGKPLGEILKEARKARQYEHEIGVSRKKSMEFNDIAAKVEMQQKMIDLLTRQGANTAQRPQETREQLLARLSQAPDRFIDERVNPIYQELQSVRGELYHTRSESARERARQAGGYDPDLWEEYTPALAAIMHARQLDPAVPANWKKAAETFKGVLVPKVEVPKPGAPPAGQAKSTAKPSQTGVKFKSARHERAAKDVAESMGFKPGTKRYEALMADLAKDATIGEDNE